MRERDESYQPHRSNYDAILIVVAAMLMAAALLAGG
jgi:hypothetical protein